MPYSNKIFIIIIFVIFLGALSLVNGQDIRASQLERPIVKPTGGSSPESDLELISRVINRPYGVDVHGDMAAVLSISEFALIDVKNPTTSRIVDYVAMAGTASENRHQGQLQEVVLGDNYAYAIWACAAWVTSCEGSGRLEIIDITDETAPKLVGSLETELGMLNLTVLDSMVYLRLDHEQIAIVDITNPSSPQLRSITPLSGRSSSYDHRLKIYKNNGQIYLYTAKSNSINYAVGLVILDVTNPETPSQLSYFEPANIYIDDLDLVDTGNNQYVYLMDSNIGLRVINVTDPMHPVQVNTYDFGVVPSSGVKSFPFVISGEHIYVPIVFNDPVVTKELHILDISDPTTPVSVNTHDTPYLAEVTDITASDALLFITDFAGGLQILDIANSIVPVQVGEQSILQGFTHADIAVDGQYLYIAAPEGLYIYDAFNPLSPEKISQFETSFFTSGVIVDNGTAIVVNREDGLIVLDVTDPRTPTQIGITDEAFPAAENVVLQGRLGESAYAFIGSSCNMFVCPSSKLSVIDLSNLASPTVTHVPSAVSQINAMSLVDSTLFATTTNNFMIWDVSNPLSPNLLSNTPLTNTGTLAVTVVENYAYIATSWGVHTLQTWDVSDPTKPELVNTMVTDVALDDLATDQRYLFATTRHDQLFVFDLYYEPIVPDIVDEAALPVTTVDYKHFNEMAIQDDFVYVLNEGLSIWHHQSKSVCYSRDAWNRPFSNTVMSVDGTPTAATGLTGSFDPKGELNGTYEFRASLNGYSSWPSVRSVHFNGASISGNENFYILGLPVEDQVSPATTTTLSYFDTLGLTTKVSVPVGAVNEARTMRFEPTMAFDDGEQKFTGNAFKLELIPKPNDHAPLAFESHGFNTPVNVTIHYSDFGLDYDEFGVPGLDEKSLKLLVQNEGNWVDVAELCPINSVNYTRDASNNILQVSVCQTGEFALFGKELELMENIFLPFVSR